jgi:hypothetical protein
MSVVDPSREPFLRGEAPLVERKLASRYALILADLPL